MISNLEGQKLLGLSGLFNMQTLKMMISLILDREVTTEEVNEYLIKVNRDTPGLRYGDL